MSYIALETAQNHLDKWLEAEMEIATSQSYTMSGTNGSRTLTRANLTEVRNAISFWEKKVAEIKASTSKKPRSKSWRIVPKDM